MENHIAVPGETTGCTNAEYTLELKKTNDVAEDFDTKDMDATIHEIKHPDALYTQPLVSEIITQLSLITLVKNKQKS